MKQPSPISVRPRKGSDLEKIWEESGRSNRKMGELIHDWGFQFKNMVAESDRENEQ